MPIIVPVRIVGDSPPYVIVHVHCALTDTAAPVHFVVDTGAFDAALSEDDLGDLGVSTGALRESDMRISGVGGSVRSFDMPGTTITFMGVDGQTRAISPEVIRVIGESGEPDSHPRRAFIPSILGRRFMEAHGFSLFWDFPRRVAVLEID